MLLLIIAIVLGLLAFFALRSVAGPLALLFLAGFIWNSFFGAPRPAARAAPADAAPAAFVSPYPVPAVEREVCAALDEGNERFTPLEAAWHDADGIDRSNEVRRKLAVDAAHKRIDELFAGRNARVLAAVTALHPQAASWVARLTKIDTTEEDLGHGTKSFIVLKGDLPCGVPTAFWSKEIEGTPEILSAMAQLNAGDYVVLSGDFVPHDQEFQGAAAAIEWGGVLWGPVGGLWPAAFRAPAFEFDISEVHRG